MNQLSTTAFIYAFERFKACVDGIPKIEKNTVFILADLENRFKKNQFDWFR